MNTPLKNYKPESFSESKPSGIRTLANESGVALITALLLMAVIIALVPAAIHLTSGEFDRTGGYTENREAFFVAEAGLEHAKALTEASNLRKVLFGPDDRLSALSDPVDPDFDLDNGTFAGLGAEVVGPNGSDRYSIQTIQGNQYYIRALDNDDADAIHDSDNIIILESVGVVDDTIATVRATVFNPPGTPVGAVTINGNLLISANAQITGGCGSVHTNGNLTINGDPSDPTDTGTPSVVQGFTSTGTTSTNGDPPVAQGDPVIPVPDLDVTDYKSYAEYVFLAGGNVKDKNGKIVAGSPFTGSTLEGWKWSSPNWVHEGDAADVGMYYFETDVVVGDSPNPWEITIVTTGAIQMGGNPQFVNRRDPAHPIDVQNLMLVAGTDIMFNGNLGQSIDGIVYAREQVQISGQPTINGAVLALDEFANDTNPPHDMVSFSEFSGNPIINYGCGMSTPTGSTIINVVSWNKL